MAIAKTHEAFQTQIKEITNQGKYHFEQLLVPKTGPAYKSKMEWKLDTTKSKMNTNTFTVPCG